VGCVRELFFSLVRGMDGRILGSGDGMFKGLERDRGLTSENQLDCEGGGRGDCDEDEDEDELDGNIKTEARLEGEQVWRLDRIGNT